MNYEQQIEDVHSTIQYIESQMTSIVSDLKNLDPQQCQQLKTQKKLTLRCSEQEIDSIGIKSFPIARCMVSLLAIQVFLCCVCAF